MKQSEQSKQIDNDNNDNNSIEKEVPKFDKLGRKLRTDRSPVLKNRNEYSDIDCHHTQYWYNTHNMLQDAFDKLQLALNRTPTMQELATETGMSVYSCHRHLQSVTIEDSVDRFKLKNDKILETLAKLAEAGDVKAIQLYTKIVGKWVETNKLETENKNISININFDGNDKSTKIDFKVPNSNTDDDLNRQ